MRPYSALILLLAAAVLPAGPRFDSWRILGPGGGGSMFFPTVSPHDDNDVLVACDMTGAYVSHDAGGSWRMFNLRGTVGFFVFDPSDRNTIYAGTNVLWRSRDRARTWELVFPAPASVTRIARVGDHASDRFVTSGEDGHVTALAVDPADSKRLYAAISNALHISEDHGRTWRKAAALPSGTRWMWAGRGGTVFAAGPGAVAICISGACVEKPAPAKLLDVTAGWEQPGELRVYAVSESAIHVSPDGGVTWKASGLSGSARFVSIATALQRPTTAYVSFNRFNGAFGVAKTTDGGVTWAPAWSATRTTTPENVQDTWITERFGADWAGNPHNLGVSPRNPDICYSTDYGRAMRTTDGGRTWRDLSSTKTRAGYTSTGLDVTTNYGVHFDPFDAKRMFISYTDIGLFRSEDRGASWVSASIGAPDQWVNTTYWMEFDPAVRGRAWAVMSGIHDLPRPKMWSRQAVSNYNGGVTVSDDGGRTWRVAGRGMPPTAATHILLDPASAEKSRTLYVAGFGRGVFKSTDGGETWALKNAGIEGAEPFAWRLARDGKGTLYLVVARRSDDGSIGGPGDGALYRSTDGAESWTRMTLPEGANGPNGLAIDPRDPRRLYLAAWGRATRPAATGGGVFVSTDAGGTWRRILAEDQHVYDVTVDPRKADVLYACGFSSSAWRSADRGATWKRIRGYNFKWGHRVMPDPADAGRIFITTFGGSVWHGPAEGDPKAAEDIGVRLP